MPGNSSIPMSLAQLLHARAAENPRKAALFCERKTMSYGELDERSSRLAQWFLAQGLLPGERVAIHWPNSFEVVQLYFAVFRAGLIAVAVNVRLKPVEIGYILEHSGARMCFSEPALASRAVQAGSSCPILSEIPVRNEDCADFVMPLVDPCQPALILYTSGTTAHPKGVTHTHRSLVHTAQIMAHDLIDAGDIVLPITQLMHAAALNGFLLPGIYQGATIVLLSAPDPASVLDAVESFHCTVLFGLPALIQFVVEEQVRQPRQIGSLRIALAGGDTVSVALQDRFKKLFGLPLLEIYGMTETLPITSIPPYALRPGSMGKTKAGFELRIVNAEGEDLPDGDTGEVMIRSAANCIAYWNDPAATEHALGTGWLRTGDLAARDADGYYWFKGREKQIIIRAGSNISPQEVEEALYLHPAVLEAGVVGMPDSTYGEQVVAFVALRSGQSVDQESLREFSRQRLADYKVPERIVFVDELPKGPSGKVQRSALKERLSVAAAQ
jgi:long-chain acyl-CoA synthetase